MKLILRIIKFNLLVFVLGNCQEPFYPPVETYGDHLVVEGLLTDQPENQVVKLSRTFRLDTMMVLPERGAIVELISDENTMRLDEREPGKYVASYYWLQGQVGAIYQLSIHTSDGNQYLSEPVKMKYVPPIDSIHWQWEEKPSLEEFGTLDHHEVLQGVQIYISTHDETQKTSYYRWDWEETYEFKAQFESLYKWDNDIRSIVPRLPEEQIFKCWNTVHNKAIHIYNTGYLSGSLVGSFPLHFVSNRTRRLQRRYSILVWQYGLSESGYTYFQDLKNISENTGSIFDNQPFQVRGNVSNINDSEEIVLGYFDVTSAQKKRIFINNAELPIKYLGIGEGCEDSYEPYNLELVSSGEQILLDESWTQRWCGDCTIEGVNKKPDFW